MRLVICGLILLLSSCTARDYHLGMLNETSVNTKQAYHIREIQKYNKHDAYEPRSKNQVCYTYPPALGSFSTGCHNKDY